MESESAEAAKTAADTAQTAATTAKTAADQAKGAAEDAQAAAPAGSPNVYGIVPAALALVGAGIIVISGETTAASFKPDSEFKLFAGFYVIAQAVERIVELGRRFIPGKSADAKANIALIAGAFAVLGGIGASAGLGLHFLDAVAMSNVPKRVDVLVSGLLIAGGTAGLHELISRIEKAKQAAAVNVAAGSADVAQKTATAAAQAGDAAAQAGDAAKKAADAQKAVATRSAD